MLFEFVNPPGSGISLAGGGIGSSMEAADSESQKLVRLTTVDIHGLSAGEFGTTLASEGRAHSTSIIYGNPDRGNINALGVASEYDFIFGSNQSRDFNPREAWEFEFDTEVELKWIEFESWSDSGAGFTLSSPAFETIEIAHEEGNDDLDEDDIYHLEPGTRVPANTPVKLLMTGSSSSGERSVRIESLAVVPVESSGFADYIAGYPELFDDLALPEADPDGDGLVNLLEYILDRHPGRKESGFLPEITITEAEVSLRFERRASSREDTNQVLQYSTDLSTWTDLPLGSPVDPGVIIGAEAEGMEEVTVLIERSAPPHDHVFLRLSATEVE
ncbi:MAG: hypothetical protein Q7Q71_13425 [Verrucomicrobiota bacterium JB023]|nr:hypothetical protein [Verrucomicrobiota bacterium JB023]